MKQSTRTTPIDSVDVFGGFLEKKKNLFFLDIFSLLSLLQFLWLTVCPHWLSDIEILGLSIVSQTFK